MAPPHDIGRHVTAAHFICRRLKSNNATGKRFHLEAQGKKEGKKKMKE